MDSSSPSSSTTTLCISTMATSYPPPPQNERTNQTPTPSQAQHPSFSSSSNDFTSPSAYLNSDAYATTSGESTPHFDYDHSTSSSMSIPPGIGGGDDMYDFKYNDFSGDIPPHLIDHPTPSARQDDQTPIVPESQAQIPPTAYPTHPVHVKEEGKPLLSPFRPDHHDPQPTLNYAMVMPQPQYIDPSTQPIYFHTPGHHGQQQLIHTPYYDQSPAQPPVMLENIQPQYYAPTQNMTYFAGPTRSQHGSPSSVGSSGGGSLPRSTSTSTDYRHRAKVKLTYEDKRNIVELHRSNSSLRQEDIARQYGVDRSTISKIILAQHRWTQPPEQHAPPQPKVCKAVGGRFPAIETMMHQWMDEQIAAGHDVRDNIAREKAKEFAKRIGFPMDRFKASAKWLDKFKERRKELGKPNSPPMMSYGAYAYTMVHPEQSMMYAPSMMISRSHSAATFSSDSSQDMYHPSPNSMSTSMTQTSMYVPTPEIITPNRVGNSESDLLRMDTTPSTRARSQSSPQLPHGPGTQSPSSGKAKMARPSPFALQRQASYHGTSPSPRRPALLTRSNTAQMPLSRRTRPTSLAASAFGITPIVGDDAQLQYSPSPLVSPATSVGTSLSSMGTHSRHRSDVSLAPFTNSMGGMTISPDMSDGDHAMALNMGIPLTPMTPGNPTSAFAPGDYAEMPMPEYSVQPTIQPGQLHQSYDKYTQQQYSTPVYNPETTQYMPNLTDQATWQ